MFNNAKLLEAMTSQSDYMIRNNLKSIIEQQPKKILKKILRDGTFRKDPFFWNNGGLTLAINKYRKELAYSNTVSGSVGLLLKKKQNIKLIDNTLYYYANYDLHGNEVHDMVYDFLTHYKRDNAGSIMYRLSDDSAYLDTIGMVCPFLVRYGVDNNNEEAIDLAMIQFHAFFLHGMDTISGLPYHGYNVKDNQKQGVVGWGRGLGWMLFGMSESLSWMDKKTKSYKELEEYLRTLFEIVLKYQKEDGSFSWQVQAIDGHSDSSATGMIGYSLLKYADTVNKIDDYRHKIVSLKDAVLKDISKDGIVSGSSSECRGFSMYPQTFEVNSWGQAFCTLFLIELIGISSDE